MSPVPFRDVTERKRAEETFRQSEDRYDALQVGVLTQGSNAEILRCDPKALELLGLSEDQLRGKTSMHPSWNVIQEDGSAFPRAAHPVTRAIATGRPVRNVVMGVFRPGMQDRVWLLVNADPQLRADGSVREVVCTLADLTERKEAELYREAGRELLEIFEEPGSIQESVQRALAALRTRIGLEAIAVRLRVGDDFPYLASEGFSPSFLAKENLLGGRSGICRGPDGKARLECTCGLVLSGKTDPASALFTVGGSFWTGDSFTLLHLPDDPRFRPRNECIYRGYASVALIPLRIHGEIAGLLQLNDRRKGRFTAPRLAHLEELAAHIGEAVQRKGSPVGDDARNQVTPSAR